MKMILLLLIAHWYLSLFCQTFFLHRYAAHAMFKMSKAWERFFFILTYICQGPSFLNPRAYSILHQRHHEYSDDERDPHSPHNFTGIMPMMLHTLKEYQATKAQADSELESFMNKDFPRWDAFERVTRRKELKVLWILAYLAMYLLISPPWYVYFALPLHFVMGPIQGAIVNWFGHKVGYRNFDMQDKSRNTVAQDIFLMGELFQNNHHMHPKSMNFAVRWFELDPTYALILLLDTFDVIQIPTEVQGEQATVTA